LIKKVKELVKGKGILATPNFKPDYMLTDDSVKLDLHVMIIKLTDVCQEKEKYFASLNIMEIDLTNKNCYFYVS
jgi:hypothetical protein